LKLLIAIPALDEEDSIESIIENTLAARERIIANTMVSDVEVAVVSDGSTDRTVERAELFADQINLIVFEKNRGYGAAIMEAWGQSDAELLGFLDADGTCNPDFFVNLCKTLEEEKADIVLGCRLNPESRMPLVRIVGNTVFAWMLRAFSSAKVRDVASGIRVVRRLSLPKLMPLPTGLHFTPAMSARSVLMSDIKISEIDMPYNERDGESKLSLVKDGLRFLRVIFEAALLFRPSRPLAFLGILSAAAALGLMAFPTTFYIQSGYIQEWMIYRFVVTNLLGMSSCLLFCSAYLMRKIVSFSVPEYAATGSWWNFVDRFFEGPFFWVAVGLMTLAGGGLVFSSFLELVQSGATYEHWSRFIGMSFLVSIALILLITRLLDYCLELIIGHMDFVDENWNSGSDADHSGPDKASD
jgi:glycosyltransferase involved in cell wall biosynthesis